MKQSYSNPLHSDVTISENVQNPRNMSSFINSISIQEFISSNQYFHFSNNRIKLQKYCTKYDPNEDWQINTDSRELSITEVTEGQAVIHNVTIQQIFPLATDPTKVWDFDMKIQLDSISEWPDAWSQDNYFSRWPAQSPSSHHKNSCSASPSVLTGQRSCEKRFACDYCNYTSNKLYTLKAHTRTHTGEKPFVCDTCQFACNDGSTLKRHKYTHTGLKPFSCQKCNYRCTRNTHLQRHINTHHNDLKFMCDQCAFMCNSKTILCTHKLEHSDTLMKCSSCTYVAYDRSLLRRHSLIHTNEKAHSCYRCNYKCRRRSHLKRHLQFHERKDMIQIKKGEVNPLVCLNCGWVAENPHILAAHKCSVLKSTSYFCQHCQFTAETLIELSSHNSIHTKPQPLHNLLAHTSSSSDQKQNLSNSKIKKYSCKDCSYKTDYFSSMRKHRLNHSEKYKFKCENCSYSSKRLLNLKRHQIVHKNDEKSDSFTLK